MSMAFLKTETLVLSTLTPVHVGSGEDYYPTNYVIEDGYLHYFGEMQLLEALPLNELNQLASIAESRVGQEAIRQIQAFIFERRDRLGAFAIHRVPLPDDLETFYRSRVGRTTQVEQGGRRLSNQLAIQRSTFNPHTQTPYIPGSSIKGAIRTALLDVLNGGKRLLQFDDRKTNRPRPENSLELQQRLLQYENRRLEDDPFRLLKISDAPYRHPDAVNGLEIRFALNRKRRRSDKPTSADTAGIPILLECLAAHRARSFACHLSVNEGQAVSDLRRKLPFKGTDELAEVCNGFYRPQLEQELQRLDELGYADTDWLRSLRGLLRGELGRSLAGNKVFLLRLGRYGGAESKTLNGIRHIKILLGRDKPPKYQSESTTVWLAADRKDQQGDMLPFGWVLAETESCHLPETHAFLRRNADTAYQRVETEQAHRITAEKLRLEREREAEAQHARGLQEAKRKQMAAEQRAAMSVNQLAILKLRESMTAANKGKGPGALLFSQVRDLIKQAEAWPESERAELRHAATETLAWLAVNKQKTKEVLRALESGT